MYCFSVRGNTIPYKLIARVITTRGKGRGRILGGFFERTNYYYKLEKYIFMIITSLAILGNSFTIKKNLESKTSCLYN